MSYGHYKAEYRILLADDDPLSLLLLRKIMEKAGHVVETAADGQQALKRLDSANFDLVVLDGEMPVLDGFETAARIRQNDKLSRLPLILLSGQSIAEKNLSLFDRTLSKPISPSELLAVVEQTAAQKVPI